MEHLDLSSAMKAVAAISSEIQIEKLMQKMLNVVIENAGAQRGVLIEKVQEKYQVVAQTSLEEGQEEFHLMSENIEKCKDIPITIINYILRTKEIVVIHDAQKDKQFSEDDYIQSSGVKSIMGMPILQKRELIGIIYLENKLSTHVFVGDRIKVLHMLSAQAAISLSNARYVERLSKLYKSTERFVPKKFLRLLMKEDIENIKLGDMIEANITVLFSDIRDYTTITEQQTPKEAVEFINRYFCAMAPIIRRHHGFINQYQGDAIMALFPRKVDDALKAALAIQANLPKYNKEMHDLNRVDVRIGTGINTGPAMLCTIGEPERMDANVISDAPNTAARVEGLTKLYGTALLISDSTYENLTQKKDFIVRHIDQVRVKGRVTPMDIYQVFGTKAEDNADQLQALSDRYAKAFKHYQTQDFKQAQTALQSLLTDFPDDGPATALLKRVEAYIQTAPPADWDGVYNLSQK